MTSEEWEARGQKWNDEHTDALEHIDRLEAEIARLRRKIRDIEAVLWEHKCSEEYRDFAVVLGLIRA